MVIIDSSRLARGGRSRGGHSPATAAACVQEIRFKMPHWQGVCQRVGLKGLFCVSRIFQSQQTGRMLGTLARRAKLTLPSCRPGLSQGLGSPQAQPAPASPGQHPSHVSSWLSARQRCQTDPPCRHPNPSRSLTSSGLEQDIRKVTSMIF